MRKAGQKKQTVGMKELAHQSKSEVSSSKNKKISFRWGDVLALSISLGR